MLTETPAGNSILEGLKSGLVAFKAERSTISGLGQRSRLFTEAELIIELIDVLTLRRVRRYNKVMDALDSRRASFRELYHGIGELDVAAAVVSLRASLPHWSRPEFWGEGQQREGSTQSSCLRIEAEGLCHPVVDDPVPNSVTLVRGALVTGSNASGKSTFIKALGIASLMGMTLGTCCARRWRSHQLLVVTSMASRDNIVKGESYFVAESRQLTRLFHVACAMPCLCLIDEVLRGTNTIERVAAGAALLAGLDERATQAGTSLCAAATHDVELTVLLKERFDNLHFRSAWQTAPSALTTSCAPVPPRRATPSSCLQRSA